MIENSGKKYENSLIIIDFWRFKHSNIIDHNPFMRLGDIAEAAVTPPPLPTFIKPY